MVGTCTHTWTKWLNIGGQGSDPVHRDIFLIAKVNVKDFSCLLVSSQSLRQASVPVLHIKNKNKNINTVSGGKKIFNTVCILKLVPLHII